MEIIRDFFVALYTDMANFFKASPDFGGPITSGQMIILAIAIGFFACAIGAYLTKLFLGRFVSQLLDKSAEDPESAISAKTNFFVNYSLNSKGAFGKIVKTAEDGRFYIEPKNRSRAEKLYSKNGASPVSLIVTLVLIVALAAAAYVIIPQLLDMSAGFVQSIKPESNIG